MLKALNTSQKPDTRTFGPIRNVFIRRKSTVLKLSPRREFRGSGRSANGSASS